MEYKGQLKGFPQEIVNKMLERQVEQGNPENISVFEKDKFTSENGFYWGRAVEGREFWCNVIIHKDFNIFFEKYPQKLTNMYELW
jgi:hypothetical protein